MTYIVMARDECGTEVRADDGGFNSYEEAERAIPELRESYPEWSGFFAEELQDKAYFQRQRQKFEDMYGEDADYMRECMYEDMDRQGY